MSWKRREFKQNMWIADEGGGVWKPLKLADMIESGFKDHNNNIRTTIFIRNHHKYRGSNKDVLGRR